MTSLEVQETLQKELDKIIGNNRLITMEDRYKLPYTMAVINVRNH